MGYDDLLGNSKPKCKEDCSKREPKVDDQIPTKEIPKVDDQKVRIKKFKVYKKPLTVKWGKDSWSNHGI